MVVILWARQTLFAFVPGGTSTFREFPKHRNDTGNWKIVIGPALRNASRTFLKDKGKRMKDKFKRVTDRRAG